MPKFLMRVDPERDAYLEWSTVVDAPTRAGTRAEFAAEFGEKRMARTDKHGTSAMYYDHLPGREQEGGWDDDKLIVEQRGFLPRERLADVFDLGDYPIPQDWLIPLEDEDDDA